MNKKRGFTLIELLVVIAIIGLLSSVVLASVRSAQKKGRDARRVSDIKQLQLAVELYYDANNVYPPALTTANLVTTGYISVLPTDPSTQAGYAYTPYALSGTTGTCTGYHIGASLEVTNNSVLSSDVDISAPPTGDVICTATGSPTADFGGVDASGSCAATQVAGTACYDVKS